MKPNLKINGFIGTALLLLATPATAESIGISVLTPSNIAEMAMVRTIAIGRFEGDDGEATAFAVESTLSGLEFDGRRYFEILDGTASQKADAIISGSARASVERFPVRQVRDRCLERDASKTCLRSADEPIECMRRIVTMTAFVRLSAVSDGRIIFSRELPQKNERVICPDDSSAPVATEQVISDFSRSVAAGLPTMVPYRNWHNVRVLEDVKGLSKPDAQRFKQALKLTKSNPDAACREFTAIHAANPKHVATHYNAAICMEKAGNPGQARAMYDQVRPMLADPRPVDEAYRRFDISAQGAAELAARAAWIEGAAKK